MQDYHALANGRRGRDAGRDATGRAIQQGQAWYVRLIAEEPTLNMRSRNNVFGQLPDSAVGYDAHDTGALRQSLPHRGFPPSRLGP